MDVERLDLAEGKPVELKKVLFIHDGDKITTEKPAVEGAKVIATSQGEGKSNKVIVFKYKSKVRYRCKTGHRQLYTRLVIDKIVESESVEAKPTRKARRSKNEVTTDGA